MVPGFNKGLGWRPDVPSFKDHKYSAHLHDKVDVALKPKPHLIAHGFRQKGMITDQRETSACTGHSTSKLWRIERKLSDRSPPFPYWHGRLIEELRENNAATKNDGGAYIRDVIDGIRHEGVPRDDLWVDTDENIFKAPTEIAEKDAEKRMPVQSIRIGGEGDQLSIRSELIASLSAGHAFVTGVSCYDSFFSDRSQRTGLFLLPETNEGFQGGHALPIGETFLENTFKDSPYAQEMRNKGIPDSLFPEEVGVAAGSWGIGYLLDGFHYFDLRYLTDRNLADDTWGLRVK